MIDLCVNPYVTVLVSSAGPNEHQFLLLSPLTGSVPREDIQGPATGSPMAEVCGQGSG